MAWEILLFGSKRGDKYVGEFVDVLGSSTVGKLIHTVDLLSRCSYGEGGTPRGVTYLSSVSITLRAITSFRVFYRREHPGSAEWVLRQWSSVYKTQDYSAISLFKAKSKL